MSNGDGVGGGGVMVLKRWQCATGFRTQRIRITSDSKVPNYVCHLSVRFNKVLFGTLDSEVLRIPCVRKGSSGIF